MGNTDLNTSCNPACSRLSGRTFICRKPSYEARCTSIRFGIGATSGMRPKLRRMRLRPVNDLVIAFINCPAYLPQRSPQRGAGREPARFPPASSSASGVGTASPRALGCLSIVLLFDLHGCAGVLQHLLDLRDLVLADAFFDRLRSTFHQVLGL